MTKTKIKIMYPGKNGKFEFTKKELENLLNEAYTEGYSEGYSECQALYKDYSLTPPSWWDTTTVTCLNDNSISGISSRDCAISSSTNSLINNTSTVQIKNEI